MKKLLSVLLATAMVLALFSGVVMFGSSAEDFVTIDLKGVQLWTQAELDASSGNNGYANSVFCSMTVETGAKFLAGNAKQAIKCTYGGSGAYNSCLVNWKYGGGPLHNYSIWAPADGSKVSVLKNYDGLRIAVRGADGKPAEFTKIEFRVTQGWNYSNNMWKCVVDSPKADADGYFYFPYTDFVKHGTPPVDTSFTDYLTTSAAGISMLCYGGATQTVTYYSDMQAYSGTVPSGEDPEDPEIPEEPEEAEEIKFPIPAFDQFTADEVSKLGVNQNLEGASMKVEKDDAGHTIFTGVTSSVADWGSYKMSVSSASTINQWGKNALIGGKSFFGDVDISNKTGLYIKIIPVGDGNDFMKMGGYNAVVLGSSTKAVAIDLKNPPVTEDGYFHHDLTKISSAGGYQVVGAGWYQDCPDISDTFYNVVDQVIFNMWFNKPSTEFKFRVEAYLAAYTDTTALANAIFDATALQLDPALIKEATDLYKDKTNTDQAKVDAMVKKINDTIEESAAERTNIINAINDALDQADMLGMFDPSSEYFATVNSADRIINGADASLDELKEALSHVRAAIALETLDADFAALIQKCEYLWKYNYTEASFDNCKAVLEEVWKTYEEDEDAAYAKLKAAYDALVPVEVIDFEDDFFAGWDTVDVNDVVDINSDRICPSIGEGLNKKDVWNGGDFSSDTAFEAGDGWFSMTADRNFFDAAMGWKNLDRTGSLAGASNGGYPALNIGELDKADGIRFKMDLSDGGHVDRVLIGLSNCSSMTKEDYAIKLHPSMTGKDGYINVPFSYFENAWWTSAKFDQSDLANVICFIVEAFNVTEGTTLTISDMHGYTAAKPYEADIFELGFKDGKPVNNSSSKFEAKQYEGKVGFDGGLEVFDTENGTGFVAGMINTDTFTAAEKALTFEAVFKTTASNYEGAIISLCSSGGVAMEVENNNLVIYHRLLTDSYFKDGGNIPSVPVQPGKYYHAVYTYDGSSIKVYLNGELKLNYAVDGLLFNRKYIPVGIGAQPSVDTSAGKFTESGSINFKGSIAVANVYSKAIGAAQVSENYAKYAEMMKLAGKYDSYWQYNYTAESWDAFQAAVSTGNQTAIDKAIEALEPINFARHDIVGVSDWTDKAIADLLAANEASVGDNVDGSHDFSADKFYMETIDEKPYFVMEALADRNCIGYKNMDRSGTLVGDTSAPYPTYNFFAPAAGEAINLSKCDGIRFKVITEGEADTYKFKISNCTGKDAIWLEAYVNDIPVEAADKDGYITLPFSLFKDEGWGKNLLDGLDKIYVVVFEVTGASKDFKMKVGDFYAYSALEPATDADIAKLEKAVEDLKSFDIDSRYGDVIKAAEDVLAKEDVYASEIRAAYDSIYEIMKAFGDTNFGVVDVPGYSIYTQEEMNQFTGRDATWSFTKTDDGMKVSRTSGEGYTFANGAYGGTTGDGSTGEGYSLSDTTYGPVKAVGGKNFIDMLGGYSLSDIYAFRFQIAGGGAYIGIQYKDGVGLWNGMVTPSTTVYLNKDGYYTFKTSSIPTGQLDGWYAGKWTRDELRAMTKYILMDATANLNKNIHNWQVVLYETIDRSTLKDELVKYKNLGLASYDDALTTYYDDEADEYDIADAAEALELDYAKSGNKYWEFNYTADSWKAFQVALAEAEDLIDLEYAEDELELIDSIPVTGNLFEGWTTTNVNEVVTANSDHLGDSVVGEGLDTAQNVWKNCDFTNNTTFTANNSFAMTATASFEGKTMCWKNMDRSGKLAGTANHGYPALNLEGIKDSDGIRVKLAVDGSVTRILLGFSTCTADSGLGNKEMYALNITANSVAADGYVTIPWSYFGKCWWADAFTQDELDKMQVFIIEAFNAAEGTTVSIDDIYGYKVVKMATQEELDELAKAIAKVEDFDFDGQFAEKLADAKLLVNGAYDFQVAEALENVNAIIADYNLDTINRAELKANLIAVKELSLNDVQAVAVMDACNAYYTKDITQTAIDMAKANIDMILDVPAAPYAPTVFEVTATTITLRAIDGCEYKLGKEGNWTTSNVFEGLTPNTQYEFHQRVAASGLYSPSDESVALFVFTEKLPIEGDVSIIGEARFNETLTAFVELVNETDYTVEWYKDGTTFLANGTEYVVKAEDIGSTIHIEVVAEDYEGKLASDDLGPVGKGLPEIITNPTVEAVLPIGSALSTLELVGGEASVEGTWAFEKPNYVPSAVESGNEFNVVFTPADANYDTVIVKVAVEVSGDVNTKTFTNEELGFSITGEFYDTSITGFETESITETPIAYIDLLRAARNSETENNIIFAYTLKFAKQGYTGTLTLKTNVGEKYAGKTYTVWFFSDGEVSSAEVTVAANGDVIVPGLVY